LDLVRGGKKKERGKEIGQEINMKITSPRISSQRTRNGERGGNIKGKERLYDLFYFVLNTLVKRKEVELKKRQRYKTRG